MTDIGRVCAQFKKRCCMNRYVFLAICSTSGDMESPAHGAYRVDNIVLFTAIVGWGKRFRMWVSFMRLSNKETASEERYAFHSKDGCSGVGWDWLIHCARWQCGC